MLEQRVSPTSLRMKRSADPSGLGDFTFEAQGGDRKAAFGVVYDVTQGLAEGNLRMKLDLSGRGLKFDVVESTVNYNFDGQVFKSSVAFNIDDNAYTMDLDANLAGEAGRSYNIDIVTPLAEAKTIEIRITDNVPLNLNLKATVNTVNNHESLSP